jgi:hypothetical protein
MLFWSILGGLLLSESLANSTFCTSVEFQDITEVYLSGENNITDSGMNVSSGQQIFDLIYANLTDTQRSYPCLECFEDYTVDLWNLTLSDPCLSDPNGMQCDLNKFTLQRRFADCSVSSSSVLQVGWVVLGLSILSIISL